MTTRSLHDLVRIERVSQIKNLTGIGSPNRITSGEVDLRGYDSVMFLTDFGDDGSPFTSVSMQIEEAADDGTGASGAYAVVTTDAHVDGYTPDATTGLFSTVTTSADEIVVGYLGSKRFVRVNVIATGVDGVQCGIWAIRGHAHLTPVTQG